MTHDEYVISGALRRVVVVKHHGPGPHPGTGTDQTVHGGDGVGVADEARAAKVGDHAGRGPLGRPTLRHLAKVATYYDTFEEFKTDYQLRNYHGLYWHLTTTPDFVIDPTRAPRDASSMAGGAEGNEPGLMVTTDIGNWVEELGRGGRQYAALIELDDLTPNVDYRDTSRGFGQEIFVNKPEGARVIATYPLEQAARMSERHYHGVLPGSDEELRAVYEWGHAYLTERGGPGSGFKEHKGRPGKVGGSLPENDWRLHGFSAEEFTKDPNLPMEQMPELGKDMSIVYSDRGNKAKWVAQVQAALEKFRNATGIAPQGITITDHLPWMLWHGEPYEVLANMEGAEAEEIANVLVKGHFATSRGAYLPQGGPVIYIAPLGKKEEGFDSETIGHELGHWLTMTAAPAAVDTSITPTARYTGRMFGAYGGGRTLRGEYFADLVESLTRTGGDYERWGQRLNHDPLNADDIENRGVLMDVVRRNLVLRTAKEQPGRLVMVLMGDEIVAVPEAELDDLPEGAIINALYLWWKEHFQPKIELDLDGKAFGWEAEDIAVQGEPEDGIFAVVEEVQRPKGRKETMAEAAGQEPAPVPPDGETPAGGPGEADVKSAFETIMRAIFRGGAGSGHFGHKGRPGEVGGSLPSGEVAEEVKPQGRDIWTGVQAGAIPVGTRDVDIPREMRHTPGGAPIRGTVMSVDDPRIGDRVYHMTTALDAVSQANELSARGVGGLGGDKTDQIVSMTVSRPVGEQLVRDMRMMAAVAQEFGATEPIYDWDRETQTHLRLDRATGQPMDTMTWLRPLLNRFGEYAPQYGFSFSVADVAAYYGMREEQVATMDYSLREWGNQFFQLRNRYTGVRNPLFFSDTETLARIDPSQVGLVSIPRENLRTGALLTDFDLGTNFLEEVRLYGDVPLDGAEFIRDIPPATPTPRPSEAQ